ncbi:MAG: 3-oxoacyl-ACP synthase III [Planctomycetes bacterium]|nr:3-oxoacyl-ACP synthase III [Planctomycetota bacterium]
MRFAHVRLESFAHHLPEARLGSGELEGRLAPLYERLKLHVGRLELMSGIRERRCYPRGTRPSTIAAAAGELALERARIPRERVGALVHASVCRDFLEPATASVVHERLRLSPACTVFDLSNACLGFANALCVVAAMIEHGEIESGLVVSGEDGGPLVESTLRALLDDPRAGKAELKRAYASLTIGAGGAAMLLAHERVASSPTRLVGGLARAATQHHVLCQGDHSGSGDGPLMETDSEALLEAGNALARETWPLYLEELGWGREDVERIVTHQVGAAHRRRLFETLELDLARDFPTVEFLGNIGSASLPITYSLGRERGFLGPSQRTGLLGIGSGLHCLMLGLS